MKFDYNPRILEQLGKELITSDEVAFTELLKNSYDAKANIAKVHFFDSLESVTSDFLLFEIPSEVLNQIKNLNSGSKIIMVEDNGKGMNLEELEKGFFTVGTDIKEKEKEEQLKSGLKDKIILGDKGLGRLAAQRLGAILIVETTSIEDNDIHLIGIEWSKFIINRNEDAPIIEIEKNKQISYTRLWFIGDVVFTNFIYNRNSGQIPLFVDESDLSEYDLKDRLQSCISFLYSPFQEWDEDFSIAFFVNNKKIKSSFRNESTKVAHTVHQFSLTKEGDNKAILNIHLELKPWYIELIHFRIIGNKSLFQTNRKSPKFYSGLLEKYSKRYAQNLSKTYDLNKYLIEKDLSQNKEFLLKLCPIEGKIFSFHRDPFRFGLILNSARELGFIEKAENIASVKDFLNLHNGVKLYRDKYRIANLGDKDSDWLNFQQERTRGQQFFRFELGNVIGYIKIEDFYQQYIKEISSRQELKESGYSSALKNFLKQIINQEFYSLTTSAYYLTRDILYEEGLIPKDNPEGLKNRVTESEKLLKETQQNLKLLQKGFETIRENISLDTPEKVKQIQSAINQLEGNNKSLSENIGYSIETLNTAKEAIILIEGKQREAYNNYKLMANGLITEVMTHELHSILSNAKSAKDYNNYVDVIKEYLLNANQVKLYKDNMMPLHERLDFLHERVSDLDIFYKFLEKTFIKQGTSDDFENENINGLLKDFQLRFEKSLKQISAKLEYSTTAGIKWYVPKGTMTHIFYNLIDNSLYWIGERQRRSNYDDKYKTDAKEDYIKIEKFDEHTIIYSDSGTGVLSQYEFTLFHPFVSGKKEGRGMGMYIIKNLLESFNGKIELLPDENNYGNKYQFAITIKPYDAE